MLYIAVAPYGGAWIEILLMQVSRAPLQSRPVGARGLKYTVNRPIVTDVQSVAPCGGAWIEIPATPIFVLLFPVTPYASAWLEITRKNVVVTLMN